MRLLKGTFFGIAVFTLFSLSGGEVLHAQVTDTQQRAALQAQLDEIERDIANNQGTLSELQKQRTTLERDISILDTKIKNAQLQIKKSDITISNLRTDISQKQKGISEVDAKVAAGQQTLGQMLRKSREIDDTSLATLALSSGSISDIFEEIDSFQTIENSLATTFEEMSALRSELTDRKQALQEKQEETEQARVAQVLAKEAVQKDEKQKQSILSATKGQEKTYQQIINDKKKQAAAIREALFGLRDSGAIQFGTALQYAKDASAATGVRPALILAILTQESDLGKNVGSCLVTNIQTGAGQHKTSGRNYSAVMKAPRDTVPFLTVTQAIGRDWATTPVSCPQSVGYGGAMGPSQFIPSTWMAYKDRLASATGQAFPDPWNSRTAIFATAIYMADLGADGGTRTAERTAALKYFAGGNWNKPANAFYGTNVLNHADDIQAQIDILGG